MSEKDENAIKTKIVNNTERISSFEEKLGIKIENLSVKVEIYEQDCYISLMGDFFMENYDTERLVELYATCYNKDNEILETEHTYIDLNNFLGFETFKFTIFDGNVKKAKEIEKVRFYPKME